MTEGFRSLLVIRANRGAGREITRLYTELSIFEKAAQMPGFRSAELLTSTRDPDELIVIGAWDSSEAYDAWLASPVRVALSVELEPLFAEDLEATPWHVLLTHPG